MDLSLRDKVAFIAGSSRGIGLAVAQAFLREGAKVVISGRNAGPLDQARALLTAEAGQDRVVAISGDMTREADLEQALGLVEARLRRPGRGGGQCGQRHGPVRLGFEPG